VQAAEALLAKNDVRLLHVEEKDDSTRVRFADGAGAHNITIRTADVAQQVLKSCGDEAPADVYPYVSA
jgi:3-oxoacyl-[acyl-carrier-protein] synthase III